jgi:hypothetical protein
MRNGAPKAFDSPQLKQRSYLPYPESVTHSPETGHVDPMKPSCWRGRRDEQEELQRVADHLRIEAGGGRASGARGVVSGEGVSQLQELRMLREENRQLSWQVADLTLDKHILQEVLLTV